MRGMRIAALALAVAACGGGADEIIDARGAVDAPAIPPDAPAELDAAPDAYVPPDAPDGSYQPDLMLVAEHMSDPPVIVTPYFTEDDPVVIEGCVGGTGQRRLLRFDTVTGNGGNLDFYLGVPGPDNPVFEFSPAHGHYHVTGYAEYRLVDGSGTVATGHKQAFCLMDSIPMVEGVDGKYDCGNQGITAGWADVYGRWLDCQWVDITGLPSGTYTLEVEVNPELRFEELDTTNNLWTRQVQI